MQTLQLEAYLESKGHSGVELTDIDGYIQYIKNNASAVRRRHNPNIRE